MTTRITQESSPRLPAPSNYTRYLDKIVAEANAYQERQKRRERLMQRVAIASVALLVAVLAWRAWK